MPKSRAFYFENCVLFETTDFMLEHADCISCDDNSISSSGRCDTISCTVDYLYENFPDEEVDDVCSVGQVVAKRCINSRTLQIRVCDEEAVEHNLGLVEIGILFSFTYITRIICLHESDLRNYSNWGLDSDSFSSLRDSDDISNQYDKSFEVKCKKAEEEPTNISGIQTTVAISDMLTKGSLHSSLFIKFIPDVGNIKIGYGLFTSEIIESCTPIGEYVGVLLTSMPEPSSYSLNYPCSDGNHEINATEYGNMTRFINHSSDPNCSFKHVLFEGIVHVICVSFTYVCILYSLPSLKSKSGENILYQCHHMYFYCSRKSTFYYLTFN